MYNLGELIGYCIYCLGKVLSMENNVKNQLENKDLEQVSGGDDCPYCGEPMSEYFKCYSWNHVWKGTPGTVNSCPSCGSNGVNTHYEGDH